MSPTGRGGSRLPLLNQSPNSRRRDEYTAESSFSNVEAEQEEQPRIMEGFGSKEENKTVEDKQHEGKCYLKTKEGTFKSHLIVLIGNELYFFRSRKDAKHKLMHCLTGTYLVDPENESDSHSVSDIDSSHNSGNAKSVATSVVSKDHKYHPLKIVIPPNKSRLIFLKH